VGSAVAFGLRPGPCREVGAVSYASLLAVRYEVGLVTNLAFHKRPDFAPPLRDLPRPESVTIEFEGRRFVWHVVPPVELDPGPSGFLERLRRRLADALERAARNLHTAHRQERGPTVTTLITDAADYEAERLAMARFLSAVAYETKEAVEVQVGGGAGWPGEFDPPVATSMRRLGDRLTSAPAEVIVVDDARLRVVLGYYREGLGTGGRSGRSDVADGSSCSLAWTAQAQQACGSELISDQPIWWARSGRNELQVVSPE
jgi:hypothetical protein